jgi:magnesium-transporting ATPase (P-type)
MPEQDDDLPAVPDEDTSTPKPRRLLAALKRKSSVTSVKAIAEKPTGFASNRISTSKYTMWNFVPKNLFEQFRRAANIYFLFMAVLQLIPYFGVNNPFLTLAPITFVLAATAAKDAYEDHKRHQQDNAMNMSKTMTLQRWKNVNTSTQPQEQSWLTRLFGKAGRTIELDGEIARVLKLTKTPSTDEVHISDNRPLAHVENDELLANAPSSTEKDDEPAFLSTVWQDVLIGDVMYLKNDDNIPADLVILATSEPDGECFVETKNLDGETNLKARRSVPQTSWVSSAAEVSRIRMWVETEAPSSNLYHFTGALNLNVHDSADNQKEEDYHVEEKPLAPSATHLSERSVYDGEPRAVGADYKAHRIDINNTLLRGCVLRNTRWVIGVVVYTGHESKIMLNSGETPSKQSRIEKKMNRQVMINFVFLFILCTVCAIGNGYYYSQWLKGTGKELFAGGRDNAGSGEAAFLTFWYVSYMGADMS